MKKELFDRELCNQLRELINRTNIFFKDSEQSKKFNFICAIMYRFDFAINYFNMHTSQPKTEEEFMQYLMQASIIKDGVNYCYKILSLKPAVNQGIFKFYFRRDLKCNNLNNSDDELFEYFRSLTFAHPFKTDKSIPASIDGEIQYSPYCLLDLHLFKDKNSIGVYVYSNKREPFSISFPFNVLQKYVLFKFNLIKNIIDAFNNIIVGMEDKWKKHKVNRSLNNIEILNDVVNILQERYIEHDIIDDLIEYLSCDLSLQENINNVNIFRHAIIEIIPDLCDAVDDFRYDDMYKICYTVIRLSPKAHPMMHYQLEKIFCYLNDDAYGDVEWGLVQAEAFSKEFAKKWVNIQPSNMNFKEIRLLTEVACYMEYMEQNGGIKNE